MPLLNVFRSNSIQQVLVAVASIAAVPRCDLLGCKTTQRVELSLQMSVRNECELVCYRCENDHLCATFVDSIGCKVLFCAAGTP